MIKYRRNDIELCFGKESDYKRPVIEIRMGNQGFVIGSLRTLEYVNVFCKAMNYIMDGSERHGDEVRDIISTWED